MYFVQLANSLPREENIGRFDGRGRSRVGYKEIYANGFLLLCKAVFRIRFRRIRKFLGLPDLDRLVRGTDLDTEPDPSIIKHE